MSGSVITPIFLRAYTHISSIHFCVWKNTTHSTELLACNSGPNYSCLVSSLGHIIVYCCSIYNRVDAFFYGWNQNIVTIRILPCALKCKFRTSDHGHTAYCGEILGGRLDFKDMVNNFFFVSRLGLNMHFPLQFLYDAQSCISWIWFLAYVLFLLTMHL